MGWGEKQTETKTDGQKLIDTTSQEALGVKK